MAAKVGVHLTDKENAAFRASGLSLKAWLRSQAPEGASLGVAEIPLHWISGPYRFQEGPFAGQRMNPRQRFPELEQARLRNSLRANGQQEPLLVHVSAADLAEYGPPFRWSEESRPHVEIVDGERRWREARAAGLATLRCEVRTWTDEEALRYARVTGTEKLLLSDVEQLRAHAVEVALGEAAGKTREEIAAALGYDSPSTLSNDLGLLKLPDYWLAGVEAGDWSRTALKNYVKPFLSKLKNDAARARLFGRAAAACEEAAITEPKGLSDRQVKEIVLGVALEVSWPLDCAADLPADSPMLPAGEHDAECGCGAPDTLVGHRRCYNPTWYETKLEEMRRRGLAVDTHADLAAVFPEERERQAALDLIGRTSLPVSGSEEVQADESGMGPRPPGEPRGAEGRWSPEPCTTPCRSCGSTLWGLADLTVGVCEDCTPEHFRTPPAGSGGSVGDRDGQEWGGTDPTEAHGPLLVADPSPMPEEPSTEGSTTSTVSSGSTADPSMASGATSATSSPPQAGGSSSAPASRSAPGPAEAAVAPSGIARAIVRGTATLGEIRAWFHPEAPATPAHVVVLNEALRTTLRLLQEVGAPASAVPGSGWEGRHGAQDPPAQPAKNPPARRDAAAAEVDRLPANIRDAFAHAQQPDMSAEDKAHALRVLSRHCELGWAFLNANQEGGADLSALADALDQADVLLRGEVAGA